VLLGDSIRKFGDGVIIAAHEIAQEAGGLIVLVDAGFTRLQALPFNAQSGLAAAVGGAVGDFVALSWRAMFLYLDGRGGEQRRPCRRGRPDPAGA
jgi:zinc transporter ZupT